MMKLLRLFFVKRKHELNHMLLLESERRENYGFE